MNNRLQIVLLGSGPMAASLSNRLGARGHIVRAILRDTAQMWGKEEMEQANLPGADLALAITGRDESSLALALAARKIYGTPALAVVADPEKARSYRQQSIEILCSTTCAEQSIVDLVERGLPPPALTTPGYLRMILLWLLAVVLAGIVWPLFLYYCVLPSQKYRSTRLPGEVRQAIPPAEKRPHAFLDTF